MTPIVFALFVTAHTIFGTVITTFTAILASAMIRPVMVFEAIHRPTTGIITGTVLVLSNTILTYPPTAMTTLLTLPAATALLV
ncbi:uncharacterized protein DEA37_0011470 [Paragonimus westermani]|uniref:Uncharacterized protein n=1 Tax=Paragonimus westermani TaxID=34504 RepID=A0A5J4N810_9TREM|nr:uncharacterized protein DEA37_0011470 [Paragonimus westermani]